MIKLEDLNRLQLCFLKKTCWRQSSVLLCVTFDRMLGRNGHLQGLFSQTLSAIADKDA